MLMITCIYVSMSLYDRVFKDHSYGGVIYYAVQWDEEFIGFMGNQVGRVTMIDL